MPSMSSFITLATTPMISDGAAFASPNLNWRPTASEPFRYRAAKASFTRTTRGAFASDLRIAAEARLPEGVSEHDDLRVPFLVLATPESPPQLRPRAERVEEGRRDSITCVTFRG